VKGKKALKFCSFLGCFLHELFQTVATLFDFGESGTRISETDVILSLLWNFVSKVNTRADRDTCLLENQLSKLFKILHAEELHGFCHVYKQIEGALGCVTDKPGDLFDFFHKKISARLEFISHSYDVLVAFSLEGDEGTPLNKLSDARFVVGRKFRHRCNQVSWSNRRT